MCVCVLCVISCWEHELVAFTTRTQTRSKDVGWVKDFKKPLLANPVDPSYQYRSPAMFHLVSNGVFFGYMA